MIEHAIANLRHIYHNIMNGGVRTVESAQMLARGLLSQTIEELEQKEINLKPITSFVMTDIGGDLPYYCVVAAYTRKEDAVEALERIN